MSENLQETFTGSEASTSQEKAEAFRKYFASKCSLGGEDFIDGNFPSVRPRTCAKLRRIRFREKEVEKIGCVKGKWT